MAFAEITIKVAGKNLADDKIRCGNLRLNQPLWGHHEFEVECLSLVREDSDALGGTSEALDALHEQLGEKFELEAAWEGESAEQGLQFTGVITGVRAQRQLQGAYAVILRGSSPTIQLDAVLRNRMWEEKSVGDIIQDIASEHGEVCDVQTSASTVYPFVVQHGQTDFQFLQRLCARNHVHMYYNGSKLVFADSIDMGEQSLTMGRAEQTGALHEFAVELKTQPGGFRSVAWEPGTASHLQKHSGETQLKDVSSRHPFTKVAVEKSDQVFPARADLALESPAGSLAELDTDLANLRESWAAALVVGTGSSDNLALDPGTKLTVEGVSEQLLGAYVITSIQHEFQATGQGYRNAFTCVPEQNVLPPRDLQPWRQPHLWSALVIDTYDPEQKGRVKVRFNHPVNADGQEGRDEAGAGITPWVAVATPHLGEGWGWVSLPEVGDEVLVAAIDGDMHRLVVIGSVPTGLGSQAFEQLTSDEISANEGKVFLTKSGNRLLFRDTSGKETIEITTPDQKNRVTLTMDGGPAVQIDTEGLVNLTAQETVNITAVGAVTVESDEDIALKAGGDLNLEAKGKVNIKADGDSEVAGMNVNVKSQGGTIKASPSGVDVKGAMIKLN